jgi:HEAT repeat protein
MLDTTSQKLLHLLKPPSPPEMRSAAALVLGEVGSRDSDLGRALCDALSDSEPTVRLPVLNAVGKLRIEQALPQLLERVQQGGPEAEVAAVAAARLGAKATRALQELMGQVAPGLRRRIAAALAAAGTTSAEAAALESLLDKDPGVVDAATRSLISEVSSLPTAHQRGLADHILTLLQTRKGPVLAPASETALVRLLSALGDSRGEVAFWARVEAPRAPELRAAALQALGALPLAPDKGKLKRLFACAADTDFRVAAPALMILKALPVSTRGVKDWLPLLDAPDTAARRLAVEKLAEVDTPEVAEALVRQIGHRDAAFRGEVLGCLTRLESGRAALAKALLAAGTADEVWALARAQTPFVRQYAPEVHKKLFSQASAYLDAGDRRAEPLLFLLREADGRWLRDQLEERAIALRKKKAYAEALVYLRLLAREPACGEEMRFELAGCALKVSTHDLAAEARAADPALQQFARLVHNPETPPLERVKQAKWLDPEDLFYLGFHFVEGERGERDFGGQVLRLLLQRSPRSKLARDAKSKLRSAGLE